MQKATFQRAPHPCHGYAPQPVTIEKIGATGKVLGGYFSTHIDVTIRFSDGHPMTAIGKIDPENDKQLNLYTNESGVYDTLSING